MQSDIQTSTGGTPVKDRCWFCSKKKHFDPRCCEQFCSHLGCVELGLRSWKLLCELFHMHVIKYRSCMSYCIIHPSVRFPWSGNFQVSALPASPVSTEGVHPHWITVSLYIFRNISLTRYHLKTYLGSMLPLDMLSLFLSLPPPSLSVFI